MRPFIHWHLLPRVRRRAQRRSTTTHSAQLSRASILAAVEFLDWITQRSTALEAVTQDDIEVWLTSGPPRRYAIASFVKWTNARQLTTGLVVPHRRSKSAGVFLDDDAHTDQLRRCLYDEHLPTHVRVAGALMLLFGVTAPQVTALTVDNVGQRSGQWHLQLGDAPICLPAVLGNLLEQLLHQQRDPTTVGQATGPTPFLFPGMIAGRPRNAKAFTSTLTRHGITALAARNSTRRALAADLPAVVIADLFGIHINTAVQWARQGQTDWTNYLAERPSID